VPSDCNGPTGPLGSPRSTPISEDPERDLAGALHEVSNALTVIIGWLDRARASAGANEDLCRAIDTAYARARDGRYIARSAIGAPVDTLAKEQPLEELVTEALTGVLPEAAAREVTLAATPSGTRAGALVDDARIALQIVTNLLLNAIAFSPPGGTVTVDADLIDDEIVVRVRDEGPGILPERRERVFSRGRSTRDGGAGIGLVHARALARRYGGELSLETSERGACFVVKWPRAAVRSSRVMGSAFSRSLAGRRVLVVEDDAAVLILLETALSARGAEVICARDTRELAIALGSAPFHAALLDLSPLGIHPGDQMRAVRSGSPSARVVVISGSALAPPDDVAELIAAWVRKPFDLGEVLAALS
jgi:CheY-like chemotaxis protein